MSNSAPKSLRKGELTRAAILEMALDLASRNGLEGLTIGLLAERMRMSKSGVFAHFGSREDLQIEILKLYHHQFEQEIFYPAMALPRGLPRLRALFSGWVRRVALELLSGCIYISGAVEYDDRPGAIREALFGMVRAWQDALLRATRQAIELGQLHAGADARQLVFEMHGLILALHHDARFMQRPGSVERAKSGFDRLIDSYCTAPGSSGIRDLPQAPAGSAACAASAASAPPDAAVVSGAAAESVKHVVLTSLQGGETTRS